MKIHWSNGQVANIELIKNEFVEYWHSIAVTLEAANKRIDTWHWHEIPAKDTEFEKVINDLSIRSQQIIDFNNNVDELADKFDIHFPGKMYEDQPQIFLNKIHHFITHGSFTQKWWDLPNANIDNMIKAKYTHWKEYDADLDHGTPDLSYIGKDTIEINRIMFEMNCEIHEYENTIVTPRKEELLDWGFEQKDGTHVIQRWRNTDFSSRMFDTYPIENNYRKYCTFDTEPDLWLPFSVLGKEYITCWLDTDNPLPFDVTNIDRYGHMGFEWQPNSFTTQVLGHSHFKKYLEDHKVPHEEFIIGKIPLGYCTNKKDLDLDELMKSVVVHVDGISTFPVNVI